MTNHRQLSIQTFADHGPSLAVCLDEINAGSVLKKQDMIIIKPNLINASPFPVTTSPEMTEALVLYVRRHFQGRIIVAEGCGDAHLETRDVFRTLGYENLARRHGVELVDLNEMPLVRLENNQCRVLREIYLPDIVFQGFLISLPVLKRHSLARVTLSMKNMMGLAPPRYYQVGGSWKKSAFHSQIHQSIFELNTYRKPDLAIIDASVGLAEYHLGGARCDPPVNKLIAGYDPVTVDALGAGLLGFHWSQVPHIGMAHNRLGMAEV